MIHKTKMKCKLFNALRLQKKHKRGKMYTPFEVLQQYIYIYIYIYIFFFSLGVFYLFSPNINILIKWAHCHKGFSVWHRSLIVHNVSVCLRWCTPCSCLPVGRWVRMRVISSTTSWRVVACPWFWACSPEITSCQMLTWRPGGELISTH